MQAFTRQLHWQSIYPWAEPKRSSEIASTKLVPAPCDLVTRLPQTFPMAWTNPRGLRRCEVTFCSVGGALHDLVKEYLDAKWGLSECERLQKVCLECRMRFCEAPVPSVRPSHLPHRRS